MKQILVMIAAVVLVGCGKKDSPEPQAKNPEPTKVAPAKLIADPIVEKAIREELNKPTGELTKADLAEVSALRSVQITDAGLKEMAKLHQLTALNLTFTKITDAGLKEVAKFKQLKRLWLGGTQITDAGLGNIAKLQKLTNLDLSRTQITDAGLKDVAKMKQLTYLILRNTQVTKAGVVDFYDKSLSNCIVSNDYKVRPRKIENIPTRRRNPRESP